MEYQCCTTCWEFTILFKIPSEFTLWEGKGKAWLDFQERWSYSILSAHSDSDSGNESKPRSSSLGTSLRGNWRSALQFWILTVLLSLMGSRVFSLIVLEFSLRAVSTWASAGLVSSSLTNTAAIFMHCFMLVCICFRVFFYYTFLIHVSQCRMPVAEV